MEGSGFRVSDTGEESQGIFRSTTVTSIPWSRAYLYPRWSRLVSSRVLHVIRYRQGIYQINRWFLLPADIGPQPKGRNGTSPSFQFRIPQRPGNLDPSPMAGPLQAEKGFRAPVPPVPWKHQSRHRDNGADQVHRFAPGGHPGSPQFPGAANTMIPRQSNEIAASVPTVLIQAIGPHQQAAPHFASLQGNLGRNDRPAPELVGPRGLPRVPIGPGPGLESRAAQPNRQYHQGRYFFPGLQIDQDFFIPAARSRSVVMTPAVYQGPQGQSRTQPGECPQGKPLT